MVPFSALSCHMVFMGFFKLTIVQIFWSILFSSLNLVFFPFKCKIKKILVNLKIMRLKNQFG